MTVLGQFVHSWPSRDGAGRVTLRDRDPILPFRPGRDAATAARTRAGAARLGDAGCTRVLTLGWTLDEIELGPAEHLCRRIAEAERASPR